MPSSRELEDKENKVEDIGNVLNIKIILKVKTMLPGQTELGLTP